LDNKVLDIANARCNHEDHMKAYLKIILFKVLLLIFHVRVYDVKHQ